MNSLVKRYSMKNVDVQLIQRVLDGDDTAFSELVDKYRKSVHALAWRKVQDFHIAEDITQETFLNAYQNLSTLKESQSFASWLYVIAVNRCKAWLRKKRLWTQSLENTSSTELEKATYSSYVSAENERASTEAQREVVKKLLAKLQESDRTVITLYYLGGMTYEEISRFLGVSVSAIKNRLYRARQFLKKEEPMIREALENYQITPHFTDNIMREIGRLKPTAPTGGKPFVPWAIAATSAILIVLILGLGSQNLVHFQQPYTLDAQAEMTVELVDTPIVLNIDTEPDVRNQLGNSNVLGISENEGQKPDEVLFAAAESDEEDKVSVPKQQWIQSEPVKGSLADGLSVTSNGELYSVFNRKIYKMESDGEAWQQITNIDTLGVKYWSSAFIEKWNDTLYLLLDSILFTSSDDGKTWELTHTLQADFSFALDFILTKQAFYIITSNYTAFQSEDKGITWETMNVDFPQKPNSIVVIQDTMFAGTLNELYRLKDDNWERIELPGSVSVILSVTGIDGKIYVAGEYNKDVTSSQKVRQGLARGWWIFRSTDLGETWEDITPTNVWSIMGLPPEIKLVAAGETLLAMERGMVRSNDGGNTWQSRQLPGTTPSMDNRLSFAATVNERTIYVGSKKDGLYRTTDGGISWDTVNINGPNWNSMTNLIKDKGNDIDPDMSVTLYAEFGGDIVKTTDMGKSWRTINMGVPMASPVRENPPYFSRIGEFDGNFYAKSDGWRSSKSEYKTGLYRISEDGNSVMSIQDMPTFHSSQLRYLWKNGRKGSLDVSDMSFIEQLDENFVGADQFFKTLARGKPLTQAELNQEQLYQDQERLILDGLLEGAFAVSDNTFYFEYNFNLFRWNPGETEWYDTGVQETGELLYFEAAKALESEGIPIEKIGEIIRAWQLGFKLAVSGNTVYAGKRDGHLVVSFDKGTNWIELTSALPFTVKAYKDIVIVSDTVYVATDAGVAVSDRGNNWGAITDKDGMNLNMDILTVDDTKLYGFTKETGIYRLENGTWNQIVSEIPDNITSLAVDGNTIYIGTQNQGMLHFNF